MTYTGNHIVHDADSHLMEPRDWLIRYADPAVRARIELLDLHGLEKQADEAISVQKSGSGNLAANNQGLPELMTRKNWAALGAFDPADRSRALELLGFRSQLVFSTYSHLGMIQTHETPRMEPEVLYGMVDAHNRGMIEFCASDERLLPVGFVALQIPERAITSTKLALELGCVGIEIPSYPAGPYSLTHPVFNPIYKMLEEYGHPLLFHVGGGGSLVNPVFAENGRVPERLFSERETSMPSLTYIGIPAPLEMALAALILDGVFERFPNLKCGVIEQGATWVPGFMQRLDVALYHFGRPQQSRSLSLRPSDYFRRQVRVTPFPYENIGWLVDETGSDIYLFGSDYPHDEGGNQPLELFDLALRRHSAADRAAIYWRNFEDLMGSALPSTVKVPVQRVEEQEVLAEDEVLRRTGETLAVHRRKALLRILVRDAASRLSIVVDESEVQQAVDEFRMDCGLFDFDDTLAWMEKESVTEDVLVRVLQDGVLAEKVRLQLGDQVERELQDQIRVATARKWNFRRSVP
jgi:predicted TIM-barrel fold metal-dependent hydrolase